MGVRLINFNCMMWGFVADRNSLLLIKRILPSLITFCLFCIESYAQPPSVILQDGHANNITSIRRSPGGKFFATGDEAGTIKIWDSRSFKIAASFKNDFTDPIRKLIFLNNGYILTKRSFGGQLNGFDSPAINTRDSIRFWNLSDYSQTNALPNSDAFFCQVPDTGKNIIIAYNNYNLVDKNMMRNFYSESIIASQKPSKRITVRSKITAIDCDSQYVYVGYYSGLTEIRKSDNLSLVKSFNEYSSPVKEILLTKKYWAYFTGDFLQEFPDVLIVKQKSDFHTVLEVTGSEKDKFRNVINAVSISDDEKFIAFSKGSNILEVMGISGKEKIQSVTFPFQVSSLAFLKNTYTLLVGGDDLVLYNFEQNRSLKSLNKQVSTADGLSFNAVFNASGEICINYPSGRKTTIINPEKITHSEFDYSTVFNKTSVFEILDGKSIDANNLGEKYRPVEFAGPVWHFEPIDTTIHVLAVSDQSEFGSGPTDILVYHIKNRSFDPLPVHFLKQNPEYFSLEHYNRESKLYVISNPTKTKFFIIDAGGKEIWSGKWFPFASGFSFSPTGKYWGYISADTVFTIFKSGNKKPLFEKKVFPALFSFSFMKNQEKLVFSDNEGTFTLNLKDLLCDKLPLPGNANVITLTNDDKKVALAYNYFSRKLIIYDSESKKQTEIPIGKNFILGLDFHPLRPIMMLRTRSNSLVLYRYDSIPVYAQLYSDDQRGFCIMGEDNYYLTTKNSTDLIGFRLGSDTYGAEQFDMQYNRPDKILKFLGTTDTSILKMYRQAYEKRLKKSGFNENMFSLEWHTPQAMIQNSYSLPASTENNIADIKIKTTDSKYNIDQINVWVNGVPEYGVNGLSVRELKTDSVEKTIGLTLATGKNKIEVSCLNEKGVESLKESTEIIYNPAKPEKPDLYIISMSVSEYSDQGRNLQYAVKDGRDIADLFLSQTGQKEQFENIYIDTLFNRDATKENFFKLKSKLLRSGVGDQVVLFVSGHGLLNSNQDFFYATYDTDFRNPDKRGISFDNFEELMDSIPARRKLLMVDACHSGEVDKEEFTGLLAVNTFNSKDISFRGDIKEYSARGEGNELQSGIGLNTSFELMQELFAGLDRGTGTVVISAAAGKGYALESPLWNNGVFTYTIINGLKNKAADKNKDGRITISELKDYSITQVEWLTGGKQKPTVRRESIGLDWEIWQ
jgi:WD40 repeat protein